MPPKSLVVGRLIIEFNDRSWAPKAIDNFYFLCTGEKGMSKSLKTAKLHYHSIPLHRIVTDFIVQGGDVTRRDGSGGDSIYGGKFNDEKNGLLKDWTFGTVGMCLDVG
jgi:cyclophilin family peptidyl-prolyl cis-trans isomerase